MEENKNMTHFGFKKIPEDKKSEMVIFSLFFFNSIFYFIKLFDE